MTSKCGLYTCVGCSNSTCKFRSARAAPRPDVFDTGHEVFWMKDAKKEGVVIFDVEDDDWEVDKNGL